uniref:Uncharacterized protein n=1 Tax=Avena sativa TaxID=4498 RepID=A0ACD5WAE1_AVESA
MRSVGRTNTSVAVEEVSQVFKVEMSGDEFEKRHQFKGLNLRENQPSETSASAASTNFLGNNLRTTKCDNMCAHTPWLIDSSASRHMAGSNREFTHSIPSKIKENIKLADGSTQMVIGSGTVNCGSNLTLASILHVPSFPLNLLSVSCITKDLNCAAIFLPYECIFQELGTGRKLGMRSLHDGLYYLDNDASHAVAAALPLTPLEELLLQHRRLGHLSFVTMSQLYPDLYSKVSKEKLVCDACQYGKQTRSSYSSPDNRSDVPLQTIHSDVWGPSGVVSLNGYHYFVTFID